MVFDLDGTLIDSYGAITDSLNAARERFGLPALPQEEVRRMVGHGLECLVAATIGNDHVEEGVRVFRDRYARVFAERTFALPTVAGTLERLARRGYRMTVASNKPARFSRRILESLALARWLDAVEGPDTVGTTKPEPRMVQRCLSAMGLAPQQALYVGDMVLDVETARRAGVGVVLVHGGSSERADLERTGEPLIDRFGDLAQLLPRAPGGPK